MAETPEDFQKQLNIFHDYCLAWKLKVNIDKTKIICFTNGRLPQNLQFTYSNSEIEIVKEFNYLGLLLSGRFGALKSDSTHHFFRNACTKSGSLRFSQFSGC